MRISLIFALLVVLTGCKIVIETPPEGRVVSESGSFSCGASSKCTVSVDDTLFSETFRAISVDPNYQFTGWRKRQKGLCGGRKEPCTLVTEGFAGNDALMQFLTTDEVFYLEPIFKKFDLPNVLNIPVEEAYDKLRRDLYGLEDLEVGAVVDIDLQGDGLLDLVVIRDHFDGSSQNATAFILDRDKGYIKKPLDTAHWSTIPKVADFNNDGLDDLYLPTTGTETAPGLDNGDPNGLWIQKNTGKFIGGNQFVEFTDYTHSACVFDLNGDGYMDILDGNVYKQPPKVWINEGNTEFNYHTSYYPAELDNIPFAWCVSGDFNRDGYDDVMMGANSGEYRLGPNGEQLGRVVDGNFQPIGNSHVVLLSDGEKLVYDPSNGRLKTGIRNAVGNAPEFGGNWAIGALGMERIRHNDDECIDVAIHVTDYKYQSHFQVWQGDCEGGFELAFKRSIVRGEPIKQFGPAFYMKVFDVNGDGEDDFFTYNLANPELRELSLFLKNDQGSYTKTAMTKELAYTLPASFWLSVTWSE